MKIKNSTLETLHADITEIQADAIFCPDTLRLTMSIGLSQVIRRKEGEEIFESTRETIPLEAGSVIYMQAHVLPAQYIFFGAVLNLSGEIIRENVEKSIISSFNLCKALDLKSISFPMISSPRARIPYDTFSRLMLRTIIDYLLKDEEFGIHVSLIVFNAEAYVTMKNNLDVLRQEYFI